MLRITQEEVRISCSMFASATHTTSRQVMPIVGAFKLYQTKKNPKSDVRVSIGASILINEDGWVLTCKHIVEGMLNAIQEEQRAREWETITADRSVPERERQRRLRQFGKKPQIERAAVAWGHTGAAVDKFELSNNADLAVFQIKNLKVPNEFQRPRLRIDDVKAGELLCRTGYPLLEDKLKIKWDGQAFAANGTPALFVNIGIVSRFINEANTKIIELDSPGLQGQSGGPLFDEEGRICGIQFRTEHYPLAFETKPRTYYHVGQAVDVSVIRSFLDHQNIAYAT